MLYRPKQEVVRAAQFDGTAESLAGLGVHIKLYGDGVAYVEGQDWLRVVAAGYWLVINPDGMGGVYMPHEFAATYEPSEKPV